MSDPAASPLARIEAALRQLGSEHEPPAGWEERVLAATRAPVSKPVALHRVVLMMAPMLALAGLLLWLVLRPPSGPQALVLSFHIDHKQVVRGVGSGGAVGDVARVGATGRGHRMLRVYNRDQLVLSCVATPDGTVLQEASPPPAEGNTPCAGDRDTLAVSWVLQSTGEYQLIILASLDRSIPPTLHVFDRDQGALIDADLLRFATVRKFDVE